MNVLLQRPRVPWSFNHTIREMQKHRASKEAIQCMFNEMERHRYHYEPPHRHKHHSLVPHIDCLGGAK